MCTVIYHSDLNLLCKNRDKDSVTIEEIVSTQDYLGINTAGSNYLSLGVNRHGVAFVSTAINPSEWIRTVEAGETAKAKEILSDINEGLERPSKFVSDNFQGIKDIDIFVEKLIDSGNLWMAYNIILADKNGAVHIETYQDQVKAKRLEKKDIVTNHFQSLSYGPKEFSDYPSSYNRYSIAKENVREAENVNHIKDILSLSFADEEKSIWRKGVFLTVSGSILNFHEKSIIFKTENTNGWQAYNLKE